MFLIINKHEVFWCNTYRHLLFFLQYKQIILPRLKHDYMKTDLYLIRFLRAANLNLKDAEQRMIDVNLQNFAYEICANFYIFFS